MLSHIIPLTSWLDVQLGTLQGTLPFGGAGRKTLSHHYNDHGSGVKLLASSTFSTYKQKEKTTKKTAVPWPDRLPYND